MGEIQLGAIESRFADIIWENEPISSSELAKRAEEQFGWKKTTSFTVLKRLCLKGLFRNEHGTVTSLVSRGEFYATRSKSFVEENFGGSLPAFFAAFTTGRKLGEEEIAELKKIIDGIGK